MNEYGLWALPLVLVIAFIVWLYEVGWKRRNERKLIKRLKEEASIAGDNPDEVLRSLLMSYVNKKQRESNNELNKRIERIRSEN